MRVSSLQIYRQGIESMQAQQVKLQKSESQLASGLRIMKPSDDPSGAVKVLDLNTNIGVIKQYSRNVSTAISSLSHEESVIAGVNTSLQRVRELVIQGNNSTNSDSDKQSISQEIYQRLDELLALANTRDAKGDYVFGGFKVDAPPFVDVAGSISYQGDQGQRFVQVGEGSQVAVGDSGDAVFLRIPNGDGNVQVSAASTNIGSAIVGTFSANSSFIPDTYTVSFSQASASDPVSYTVTDGASNTVATGTYSEGSSISFSGVQFALDGLPADGDTIKVAPSQNQSLFETVRNIADALSRPAPDSADKARFHNDMAQGLASIDQSLNKVNSIRSSIGARLNTIDTIDSINQDFTLQLETVLSETQDLDFAEAISRFNLQLTALQAAQQVFIKTTSLSLFQYI
ncbi:MAG: flagellar hook-associated protein 3 [SAR86 cluster bacterium]|uniref:Flagellar hook-associated protein 3 n=1 Tax=SAR86 cluster bacterium TaxID=2030880 RepID=A0A2A5B517_9GAMM|nr:MAG: flagellar hook-associated protein 3 [SAR86 cluster bacterium]